MALSNEIVLRPRFKFDYQSSNSKLLEAFETTKNTQNEFIVSRIDDHVFIRFPKRKQHFWSPQLHLEIIEKDKNTCIVNGLFGPNPTIWTLFMFLHFVVAGLFIIFGIWAYSNYSLGNSFAVQLFLTLFMVLLWFVLYFVGRLGRAKGKPEMHLLHQFMQNTINNHF